MKTRLDYIFLIPFLFAFILNLHCARQSPRYDEGREILRDALFTAVTGESARSTNANAINRDPEVVFNIDEGGGAFRTQVKAISFDVWSDFSFTTRSLADINSFDIGFRRYTVRTNGGSTNSNRQGSACKSNTKTFPSITTTSTSINCPLARLESDRPAQAEVAGGGGVQFIGSDVISNFSSGWFVYYLPSLRATNDVFVIRSHNGIRYYAIQILNYYSDAGTSGYLTFRWRQIPLE